MAASVCGPVLGQPPSSPGDDLCGCFSALADTTAAVPCHQPFPSPAARTPVAAAPSHRPHATSPAHVSAAPLCQPLAPHGASPAAAAPLCQPLRAPAAPVSAATAARPGLHA
eukprot:1121033-Pelagomonas_calceolata.AAC.5